MKITTDTTSNALKSARYVSPISGMLSKVTAKALVMIKTIRKISKASLTGPEPRPASMTA